MTYNDLSRNQKQYHSDSYILKHLSLTHTHKKNIHRHYFPFLILSAKRRIISHSVDSSSNTFNPSFLCGPLFFLTLLFLFLLLLREKQLISQPFFSKKKRLPFFMEQSLSPEKAFSFSGVLLSSKEWIYRNISLMVLATLRDNIV